MMILEILHNLENNRSAYFAVTVSPLNRIGIENYLEMQGLVYEITPDTTFSLRELDAIKQIYHTNILPDGLIRLDFDKMHSNITQGNPKKIIKTDTDYTVYTSNNNGVYRYKNLDNPNLDFPNHILRLTGAYRSGFIRLVQKKLFENDRLKDTLDELIKQNPGTTLENYPQIEKMMENNHYKILEILNQMDSYLPPDIINDYSNPNDVDLDINIAQIYLQSGDSDSFIKRLNRIKIKLEELLQNNPHDEKTKETLEYIEIMTNEVLGNMTD